MQLDWTYARELQVSIQGQWLDHLFCQCVLPYSDWQWATRCISESFLSLVSGLQAALEQLRKCPECLGTDNSSAATHELEQVPGRPRGYNADYLELCTHYDLTPVTIHVNCPHEHGDVESLNRHLKRRLEQHLILRGSRDFASLEEMAGTDERFTEFAAFQNGQVYAFNRRVNEQGGNDYYESSAAHPNLVLLDLVKIFHPDLVPDHDFVYYRQLE